MAMAVTYATFDGEIIHENRGGVQRDYVADTLGSTQALLDSTGAVSDTFDYWPYGEIRSRTGATATPFTFVGTLGYFADSLKRLYVRARYYLSQQARWLTVDPMWPKESAFTYVRGKPVQWFDYFGLEPRDKCAEQYTDCIDKANTLLGICLAGITPGAVLCVAKCPFLVVPVAIALCLAACTALTLIAVGLCAVINGRAKEKCWYDRERCYGSCPSEEPVSSSPGDGGGAWRPYPGHPGQMYRGLPGGRMEFRGTF